MQSHKEANLALWEELVAVHMQSAEYDLDGFKAGRSSLRTIEVEELGDVSGKSILHLQCHFGQDTLSLARLGARVTGVDYSTNAIDVARQLSKETGIKARFICSDVYDLAEKLHGKFDIVFTTYGVLAWLDDLNEWAQLVATFLKLGGSLYLADVHPATALFKDNEEGSGIVPAASYFESGPRQVAVHGSYADRSAQLKQSVKYKWHHTVADVLNSLSRAGLKLEFFNEHTKCSFQKFACMQQDEQGWWRFPADSGIALPGLFSLKASKPL